jgi:hypothetical protein
LDLALELLAAGAALELLEGRRRRRRRKRRRRRRTRGIWSDTGGHTSEDEGGQRR